MTAPRTPDPGARAARQRRLHRSRATAAGLSVAALVGVTAGVAAANPGSSTKPADARSSGAERYRPPDVGDRDDGRASPGTDDSGWFGADDDQGGRSGGDAGPGLQRPSSGFGSTQPGSDTGSFDPGPGNGASTRSGGS
jgi:hypothetical protein